MGTRTFGFQKSGSAAEVHPRPTTHTKPFVPLTAVSKPCRPRTRTSASCEMDSGAALRARAISAARSAMRYWSTGAIFAYGVVVDGVVVACATAWYAVPSTRSSAKLLIAIALIFLDIVLILRARGLHSLRQRSCRRESQSRRCGQRSRDE